MQNGLNGTEQNTSDDFLESFASAEQEEKDKQEQEELKRLFDEYGGPIFENITADDILYNKHLYECIDLIIDDEIELTRYTTALKQIAKKYKLTTEFNSLMQAYKSKAKQRIRQAEDKEKQQAFAKRAESFPAWWDGQTIDEDMFCVDFLKGKDFKCINGFMYDVNGLYDEKSLENAIYTKIKSFCKKGIADRVKSILRTMKIKCYCPPLPCDITTIHTANGTLNIKGIFTTEKQFCTNRLAVNYPEHYQEPKVWLKFLSDLLEKDDIQTLQEYMGYCLIPCTKAQKMLMIIGNGGEGKSRIGVIMQKIFGYGSLVTGEIKDLDNGNKARFAREKLVSKLCLLDDDLDLTALANTSFLKQLITAEIPLEVEPKGLPSFQTLLYSRVIAFGNGAISSLYDKSDGFYRRQIILTAKPIPDGRTIDRNLTDKLLNEIENIFVWCFQGLQRLIHNGYEFTISEQALQNIEDSKRESCNIIDFMKSEYDFCYDKNEEIHARELYWAYSAWCEVNQNELLKARTFTRFLKSNSKKYGIEYSENIKNYEGIRARGFRGIKYLKKYKTLESSLHD